MAEEQDIGTQGSAESNADPFAGYAPAAGLEHLGAAITDADGVVSGSPANYQATRGQNFLRPASEINAAVLPVLQNDPALQIPGE